MGARVRAWIAISLCGLKILVGLKELRVNEFVHETSAYVSIRVCTRHSRADAAAAEEHTSAYMLSPVFVHLLLKKESWTKKVHSFYIHVWQQRQFLPDFNCPRKTKWKKETTKIQRTEAPSVRYSALKFFWFSQVPTVAAGAEAGQHSAEGFTAANPKDKCRC